MREIINPNDFMMMVKTISSTYSSENLLNMTADEIEKAYTRFMVNQALFHNGDE